MNGDQFERLLALLERLSRARIHYTLRHSRADALMVVAYAPGEYWEIEFLADGAIDVERYRSDGRIDDESILDTLFALWSDECPSPTPIVNCDDVNAGD